MKAAENRFLSYRVLMPLENPQKDFRPLEIVLDGLSSVTTASLWFHHGGYTMHFTPSQKSHDTFCYLFVINSVKLCSTLFNIPLIHWPHSTSTYTQLNTAQ